MWETFNVYESWLDHDEIESKIIWLENDYKNLSHSQEVSNAIKQNILDAIKQLPIDKKKDYKLEYQNKAIKAEWKLKGLYYELAAWVINTISAEKKSNYIPQINNLQETNESLNDIDFTVQNATAIIKHLWSSNKEYILNQRHLPEINKVWNKQYELILVMSRNSSSSIRWDEKVTLNFSYDWYRLIFFNDKNNNWSIDNYEWGKLTRIDHKNERKINRNQWIVYQRWNSELITLTKNQISENWVKNIKIQLYFQ